MWITGMYKTHVEHFYLQYCSTGSHVPHTISENNFETHFMQYTAF